MARHDQVQAAERAVQMRTLTSGLGRILSRPTKSAPVWPARSPRWILRCLEACDAVVPVSGGRFIVNQVRGGDTGLRGVRTQSSARYVSGVEETLSATFSRLEGAPVQASIAAYQLDPQEVPLEELQSIVRTDTRVPALYSDTHDQLGSQLRLTAELIYETKEDLVFNHPVHGLLHNVDPNMELDAGGPPSPDVLDDLLARAWKRPDCYVMHPAAIAAFHKQASSRGLSLEVVELFGTPFTTWRGLPLCPSNKLRIAGGTEWQAWDTSESDASGWLPSHGEAAPTPPAGRRDQARRGGVGTGVTDVLLVRLGVETQGVINLVASETKEHLDFPGIAVEPMGISEESIASYLLTTYTAMAVLSPGSLARASVVV
jgi:hypothetical protein